ncbi:MAG: zinc ribbon domain regulatory protein CdsZ [Parachlamydiaceae bacterium]
MLNALKIILEIQEFDMQLIQLMRLKKERLKELDNLNGIKSNLQKQVSFKEAEIAELKKTQRMFESEVNDIVAKIKKLEGQQNSVKKLEEFNALTHEMSQAEKERTAKELRLSDLIDRLNAEEDALKSLNETLESTLENGKVTESEIVENISRINAEGRELKEQRDALIASADPEIFQIYERLLRNKKDRVVVPIENRCCSGCHIMLTAQNENLVRKGERLVFCEHCSRIHYWPESEALEGTKVATKQRRRRGTSKV